MSSMPYVPPEKHWPVTTWPSRAGVATAKALRVLLTTRQETVRARTRSINHLKALVINPPEALRCELRPLKSGALVTYCARLQTSTPPSSDQAATAMALRLTAQRIQALEAEAAELEAQLEPLVQQLAPTLRAEFGVGPISAAQIVCAWSHAGRLRSEAAFATLAGVAPIPASSGQVQRHRLNRSGDRQLTGALHTIVLCRLGRHAETQAYAARRAAQGKSQREIQRCLTRHLARRLFKLLEGGADREGLDHGLAA